MKEESLISKVSQIWEGWTEKPKTEEAWFQERLKHCAPCEFNSGNKELNLLQRTKEKAFGEPFCTACGCPFSKKLSVKRATSVVRTLQTKFGVDPNKLIAAGRGENNALTSNDTQEGRSINRRTRIILMPKLDQFYDLLNPDNVK